MPRFLPLFLSTLVLAWVGACQPSGIEVDTETIETRTLLARVSESGVIEPTVEVPVAPDVSGEVVEITVQEGDRVKKGDPLISIRPDDLEAQVEQARASLNRTQAAYLQAKANLSQSQATLLQDSVNLVRTQELFTDEVVSKLELENTTLSYNVSRSQLEAAKYNVESSFYQVRSAEASLRQARQNLDRTRIYASMDGTITLLNVELGQRVVGTNMMSGTEILKIANLSNMEVVVEINENDIVNVKLGDSARVEIDAFPGEAFYGKVAEIAYSAQVAGMASTDQVTNFEVKVQVDPASYAGKQLTRSELGPTESPFRPGMTALVEIFTRKASDVPAVPIQAVTLRQNQDSQNPQGQEVVFVVEGGKVSQVPVKTGISDGTYIELKEGPEAGAVVVTGPYSLLSKQLREGMAVNPKASASGTKF